MKREYIFTSERLGFRNWVEEDLSPMAELNRDPKVMEHFPALQTEQQTIEFIQRMQALYQKKGFCYFAVDRLDSQKFIGFIGLAEKDFEADFTPCVDIGWRLAPQHWGNGFATEGAKRCLDFAFSDMGLDRVVSMCPVVNVPSEAVMKKVGMTKAGTFEHPLLKDDNRLRTCVLYQLQP